MLSFPVAEALQHPGSEHMLLLRITSGPLEPSLTCCCTSARWPLVAGTSLYRAPRKGHVVLRLLRGIVPLRGILIPLVGLEPTQTALSSSTKPAGQPRRVARVVRAVLAEQTGKTRQDQPTHSMTQRSDRPGRRKARPQQVLHAGGMHGEAFSACDAAPAPVASV